MIQVVRKDQGKLPALPDERLPDEVFDLTDELCRMIAIYNGGLTPFEVRTALEAGRAVSTNIYVYSKVPS